MYIIFLGCYQLRVNHEALCMRKNLKFVIRVCVYLGILEKKIAHVSL